MINPGNPTGQVLSREDLEIICKFCAKYDIVLLADEVYQRNIYVEHKEFVSAKKVAIETPGCENLQLISFHSTSKGMFMYKSVRLNRRLLSHLPVCSIW